MNKLEIYRAEQSNPGSVYLYPEGMFYKAYEKSAFILCRYVHPFKVSVRPLKALAAPLVSVGFPISSLPKFSEPFRRVESFPADGKEGKVLTLESAPDMVGFPAWKASVGELVKEATPPMKKSSFDISDKT